MMFIIIYGGFTVNDKCSICDSEIDEDCGDIKGYFGISPVAFCVWCFSSMTDMVMQLNGIDEDEIHRLS